MPQRGKGKKATARVIEMTEKEAKALELRKQGHTFTSIAKKMGYSQASSAHAAVTRALEKTALPVALDVWKMEWERLEHLYSIAYVSLVQSVQDTGGREPNMAALDRCLSIIDRRMKWVGQDGAGNNSVVNVIMGDQNNVGEVTTNTLIADGSKENYIAALAKMREMTGGDEAGNPEVVDVEALVAAAEGAGIGDVPADGEEEADVGDDDVTADDAEE